MNFTVLMLVVVTTVGCQTSQGTLTIVSDRIVPNQYARIYKDRVEGRFCSKEADYPNDAIDHLMKDALSKAPEADALIKAKIWFEDRCFVLEGTPVKMRQ